MCFISCSIALIVFCSFLYHAFKYLIIPSIKGFETFNTDDCKIETYEEKELKALKELKTNLLLSLADEHNKSECHAIVHDIDVIDNLISKSLEYYE